MRPQNIKQDLLRLSRNELRAYSRSQIPETKMSTYPDWRRKPQPEKSRLRHVAKSRWSMPLNRLYLNSEFVFTWDETPSDENDGVFDANYHNAVPLTQQIQNGAPSPPPPPSSAQGSFGHRASLMKNIVLPVAMVILPNIALSLALIGIVFSRQVRKGNGIFGPQNNGKGELDKGYIFVDYPATRLNFLASWLSTLAPIQSGAIMSVWSIFAARLLRDASTMSKPMPLPTAAEMALVVSLLLASFWSLGTYFASLFSRSNGRKASVCPAIVHWAATILSLCVLLAATMFAAETSLNIITKTVQFETLSVANEPSFAFGRGLSEFCLTFSREENYGFPCSYDFHQETQAVSLQLAISENEAFRLEHNNSKHSQIQLIQGQGLKQRGLTHGNLAIVLTQPTILSSYVDFTASTIGVSTQCRPMTPECDMRVGGDGGYHTQFNCTSGFWGTLGKAPNITELTLSSDKAWDPYTPGMNWKPSSNLQYGCYDSAEMINPYNTIGYDPQTGDPSNIPPLPDDKLINPIYLGVAGRFAVASESAGANLSHDPGLFIGSKFYVDFTLNCSYTTYDVNYTWSNGTIEKYSFTATPNGSVAEIYHGSQTYYQSPSDTSFLLQDDVLTAALQNSSDAIAIAYADLNSMRVLSKIGGYTTPRTNLREQTRTPLLVARIPITALAVVVAASLLYGILAVILGCLAFYISSDDLLQVAGYLNLNGLANAAFDDRCTVISNNGQTVYSPPRPNIASPCRVGVLDPPGTGMPLVVYE